MIMEARIMAVKDRNQPVILLAMKDCMVSRNEVTWVSHIISTHRVRYKLTVPKSSLNAYTGARISALLKNQVLAMSAWAEIGLAKTLLVESNCIFKTNLLVMEL